jgi:hypothetical protein
VLKDIRPGCPRVRAVFGNGDCMRRAGRQHPRLDWLEKAYDEHDFAITQIEIAPWYRSLRNEPRFTKLIARLGLPR